MFFIHLYIFLIGICVGSFLNVVIDRIPKNQKLVNSRSICPHCKKKLSYKDLMPLFSFLFLKGKCRYCKKSIDRTLPVVELLTGGVFVAVMIGLFEGSTGVLWYVERVYYLVIFSVLITVFFMDLKYRIIDSKVILVGVVAWVLYTLVAKFLTLYANYINLQGDLLGKYLIKAGFVNTLFYREVKDVLINLASALLLFLFFYFLVIVTKGRGMGGGDVKFSFLMGLVLGFPRVIPGFFISFLTGALTGIILILIRKKTVRETVPFGPFLVFGTVAGLVIGERLVTWYLKILRI